MGRKIASKAELNVKKSLGSKSQSVLEKQFCSKLTTKPGLITTFSKQTTTSEQHHFADVS